VDFGNWKTPNPQLSVICILCDPRRNYFKNWVMPKKEGTVVNSGRGEERSARSSGVDYEPGLSGMRGPLAAEARNALIQRRAYELYVQRGKQPGHEVEDWLQAEAQVSEWEETQKFG
jgi:hypothetical protein